MPRPLKSFMSVFKILLIHNVVNKYEVTVSKLILDIFDLPKFHVPFILKFEFARDEYS